MGVSAKVEARIVTQLKKYQSVLDQAKQRDISESDTSSIVRDMLCDVLGYRKFDDITAEHNIRGTFVDLAIQCDGRIRFLVEVKAIGIPLKDQHVKQAIDYAANQGTEWVILTNGAVWRTYKFQISKPIEKIMVCEFDLLSMAAKNPDVIECCGNLSREEFSKETMSEFFQRKEICSKFTLAAVLQTDAMIEALRKEIRRLSGIRIDPDVIQKIISEDVIKRELIDSEEGKNAQGIIRKYLKAQAREKSRSSEVDAEQVVSSETAPVSAATTPPVAS
jgi:hypothetical protein